MIVCYFHPNLFNQLHHRNQHYVQITSKYHFVLIKNSEKFVIQLLYCYPQLQLLRFHQDLS